MNKTMYSSCKCDIYLIDAPFMERLQAKNGLDQHMDSNNIAVPIARCENR